jgi:hypothetical protein
MPNPGLRLHEPRHRCFEMSIQSPGLHYPISATRFGNEKTERPSSRSSSPHKTKKSSKDSVNSSKDAQKLNVTGSLTNRKKRVLWLALVTTFGLPYLYHYLSSNQKQLSILSTKDLIAQMKQNHPDASGLSTIDANLFDKLDSTGDKNLFAEISDYIKNITGQKQPKISNPKNFDHQASLLTLEDLEELKKLEKIGNKK